MATHKLLLSKYLFKNNLVRKMLLACRMGLKQSFLDPAEDRLIRAKRKAEQAQELIGWFDGFFGLMENQMDSEESEMKQTAEEPCPPACETCGSEEHSHRVGQDPLIYHDPNCPHFPKIHLPS